MVVATIGPLLILACACVSDARPIEFGPETEASVNRDGGRLRVEPSAAVLDDQAIVAWNDSRTGRDFDVRVGVGIGWSISTNGGRSFAFGGYLPSDATPGGPSGADSWLGVTSRGEILLQLLHWGDEGQDVAIYALPEGRRKEWVLRGGFTDREIDKPAMATSGPDWVGIAYTAGSQIRFARSVDAGATWSPAQTISSSTHRTRTGAGTASCADSVLVVWLEGEGSTLDEIWAAWSMDSGRRFSAPSQVRVLGRPLMPPPGYSLGLGPAAFISNNAWVTCSNEPDAVFHVTYGEGRVQGSVVLHQEAVRADGELRWRPPTVIAGSDTIWAVFPSIALLGDQVGVLYYDSRHSTPDRALMDVYLSIGTSGGFEDHRVTTVSSSWADMAGDVDHAPFQRNAGDYITLAASGNRGLAAWTDGRTGQPRIMARSFRLSKDE